ncbi:MYXO-CTERM sorting domain-containing protein [Xanthomonas translucens]|uniref:MYXO-CTERM sorting domain-containing protein n=1 Tax=Xanthomonas translucens pv. translucens TaxID=134875 RepID=A0ABW9KQB1_XANCT
MARQPRPAAANEWHRRATGGAGKGPAWAVLAIGAGHYRRRRRSAACGGRPALAWYDACVACLGLAHHRYRGETAPIATGKCTAC